MDYFVVGAFLVLMLQSGKTDVVNSVALNALQLHTYLIVRKIDLVLIDRAIWGFFLQNVKNILCDSHTQNSNLVFVFHRFCKCSTNCAPS